MKLKSLNTNLLSDSDIVKLNLANIQTTEQLITHADYDSLSRLTSIPVRNLKLIKKQIIGQFSPFPEQANVLLEKYVRNLFIIESGCKEIDHMISNGFYSSEISEITGGSSTGKSQLCFQLIANMLISHPNYDCLYIDSNKNFCEYRISKILDYKIKNLNKNDDTHEINMLKSIKKIECSNLFHLIDILFKLSKSSPGQTNQDSIQIPNLLIIDNLTSLFNIFKQNSYQEINYYLNYVTNYLKYLSNNTKIVIIVVTNRSHYENTNSSNLTNNPLWLGVPNLVVCLKNLNDQLKHKFEILKFNRPFLNSKENQSCFFKIEESGIS